jgi:hypothetical protein
VFRGSDLLAAVAVQEVHGIDWNGDAADDLKWFVVQDTPNG